MDRYVLVEYEGAEPKVKRLYDDYLQSTGAVILPVWVKSLGHNADLLEAYWARTKGSLIKGSLPMAFKELIIFVVSVENGSRYCAACHAHAVLQLDHSFTYEDLASLAESEALTELPLSYRCAVDFAKQLARGANTIADADFVRLQDSGLKQGEIRELLAVIDLAVMFNVYTSAARLPIDPEYRPILL